MRPEINSDDRGHVAAEAFIPYARLPKLNHERYDEEVAKGLHDKKRGAAGVKRGPKWTEEARCGRWAFRVE